MKTSKETERKCAGCGGSLPKDPIGERNFCDRCLKALSRFKR